MRAAGKRQALAAGHQPAAVEFSVARRHSVDRRKRHLIDHSLQGCPLRIRIRNFCHLLRPSAADHYYQRGI
jgi:hypothetical protein